MRCGACVCGPEGVSDELWRGGSGIGTKTCFASEFSSHRSGHRGVLSCSSVLEAFGTLGAILAAFLSLLLRCLRSLSLHGLVAVAGRLGMTRKRTELA